MKKLFLAVLFTASSLFCQTTANHLIVPSGFAMESLSGYGYSKTLGSQADIAGLNPAAMDRFSSLSAGVTYQFETDMKPGWIGALPASRYKRSIPQSAGIILPYQNLRLGLAFSQKYNSSIFSDKIEITTVENPEGTGEFMSLRDESYVQRYSGLLSYGLNDLFSDGTRFSLGISVNYDKINYNYSLGKNGYDPDFIMKSHGSKVSWSAGMTWSVKNTESLSSLVSLFYESKVEFDNMTADEIKNIMDLVYGGWQPITKDRAVSMYPEKISLGFDHSFTDRSQMTTSLAYIRWSGTDNNKNDYPEAAASYIYSLQNDLRISAGFYYTALNIKQNDYFDLNTRTQAFFITAGAVYSLGPADIHLIIADSHLISGEYRKQLIGKISVGFHL